MVQEVWKQSSSGAWVIGEASPGRGAPPRELQQETGSKARPRERAGVCELCREPPASRSVFIREVVPC